jgi:hypothetical protein
MAIHPALIGVISSSAAAGFAYTTTGSPTTDTYGVYTSITWTGSGSFIIAANPDSLTMDVWVVAGGGGGGGGKWGAVGGAGAGGARQFTGQAMAVGTMTVTIGGGGSGGSAGNNGNNGGDTTIGSITTMPGGGYGGHAPGSGGCGGGRGQGTDGSPLNGADADPTTEDWGGDGRKGQYGYPFMVGGGGGGYYGRGSDWSSLTPAASNAGWPNTATSLLGMNGCLQTYRDGNASGTTNGTHHFAGGGGCSGTYVYAANYFGEGGAAIDGNYATGSAGSSNQRYGGGNGNTGTTWGSGGSGGANSGGGGGAASGSANPTISGFTGSGGSGGSGIVVVRFVTPA